MIEPLAVEETLEDEDSKNSSESDSSRDSKSESDTSEVVFYRQTVDYKITKSRIEVTFKDAIEMLKEEVAILKEHIHIKWRQVNDYQEMKASLGPNDLMIQVDFAGSYTNEQQDAIQSAYFGNQYFSIFTVCCYLTSIDK